MSSICGRVYDCVCVCFFFVCALSLPILQIGTQQHFLEVEIGIDGGAYPWGFCADKHSYTNSKISFPTNVMFVAHIL